jgi:hypothetical protein
MDLLSAAVDPVPEPAPPAEGSHQVAKELAVDPDPDRSDRTVSLVEFQVCLCSSFFSAQRRKGAKKPSS